MHSIVVPLMFLDLTGVKIFKRIGIHVFHSMVISSSVVNIIDFFTLSLTLLTNKLECLSLIRIFHLAIHIPTEVPVKLGFWQCCKRLDDTEKVYQEQSGSLVYQKCLRPSSSDGLG
jgi:hypothetical protein